MADSSNGPSFPSANPSEWTYDLALRAVTGGSFDIHGPAAPQQGWFVFNTSPGASDDVYYVSGDHYYYGVKFNRDALKAWWDAVNAINTAIPDIEAGHRGEMNVDTLTDLQGHIFQLVLWLTQTSDGFQHWVSSLESKDSGFKGSAAYVISSRLKNYATGLTDLHTQLTTKHGYAAVDAIYDAIVALKWFNSHMADVWRQHAQVLAEFPADQMKTTTESLLPFLTANGLVGGPGYKLDEIYLQGGQSAVDKYIKDALAHYSDGDLTQAATWDTLNGYITSSLQFFIHTVFDSVAADLMGNLEKVYEKTTSALFALTTPPPSSTGQPPPPDGSGNPPPPPDGSGNPPPPDGSGNPPPPGANAGKPPPGGGPNLPPPPGANAGKLPPPGANLAGLPPPPGANAGKLPPPGANAGKLPPPGGDPNLSPPGANAGKLPPLPPGVVPPPGGKAGGLPPPGGNAGKLPPLSGLGRTGLPQGGMPNGGNLGGGPSSGLHLPLGSPPGAAGGPPGSGLTSVGSGPAGVGGGPAGVGGGPAEAGAGLVPSQLNGGSPGAAGSAGTPGSEGGGGVPFFPPMMGGGAGAGEKPQERERQTWLSEDEAVWGTEVDASSGVIGRLQDDEGGDDILPASLPGQERLHPAVPRRRGRSTEESEQRSGVPSGERSEESIPQSATT
jgi:hypothetical protein